jgi:hypothetical protein
MLTTTTRWTLAALSAVALAGAAAAATPQGQETTDSLRDRIAAHFGGARHAGHGPGHGHDPLAAIDRVCDDGMAWGECKDLLRARMAEMREAHRQHCVEAHGQEECEAHWAGHAGHHGEA